MGFPQIGYQAFKLVAHQRLHELAKSWEQRYPGVDIVLIEPEPTDELMFQTSMMNFASRVEIARHGFESVTKHLAERIRALPGRSPSATGSTSPASACARSSSTSTPSPSRSAPGARSSRARPARCCASRARPASRAGRAVAAAAPRRRRRRYRALSIAASRRVVAALSRMRDAHVLGLAERVAVGDEHARLREARGELAAAEVGVGGPHEVRLAVGDVEAALAQPGGQARALLADRLHVAVEQLASTCAAPRARPPARPPRRRGRARARPAAPASRGPPIA